MPPHGVGVRMEVHSGFLFAYGNYNYIVQRGNACRSLFGEGLIARLQRAPSLDHPSF